MKSLDEILKDLPSLETINDDELVPIELNFDNDGTEQNIIYDENITRDMAKVLLGDKYDPVCRYKMITERSQTTIVKIDDTWPVNKPPVYDQLGFCVAGPTVEYVMKQEVTDNVQSYTDMMNDLSYNKREFTIPTHHSDRELYKENKNNTWMWVVCGLFGAMCLLGCSLFLFLSTL